MIDTPHRYVIFQRVLIGAAILIAVITLLVSGTALNRQGGLQRTQNQLVCITRLQANYMAAVGDALAAPPAPNTERFLATEEIEAVARQLHHIEKVCR